MGCVILGVGCGTAPAPTPERVTVSGVRAPGDAAIAAAPMATPPPSTSSRWTAVGWHELPGWHEDKLAEVWPAVLRGCGRPPPPWRAFCSDALALPAATDAHLRAWLPQRLQAYRVETPAGEARGLITGYHEPQLDARRLPDARHRFALHRPPADLATRKPYWTRQQLDTHASAALKGREIAYLDDPVNVLVLQIQGSGRLRITEPDGSVRDVRLAYAGHNGHAYGSVGTWLIGRGELRSGAASWPAIKAWTQRNPARVQEMLWSNPRVIFFQEEALADPNSGPRGAQGVALTPGRSIAVDPRSLPYGTLVWLDTTLPLSPTPLRRLVVAQDTGSAIVGAVRADYFWGWDKDAEQQAGRMKQGLHLWALWPRDP